MHTVKLLLFSCAFFAWGELFSQGKVNVDSLTAVLEQYPGKDTVKVKKLLELAFNIYMSHTENAIEHIDSAIAISDRLQSDYWSGKSYRMKGSVLSVVGDPKEAVSNCEKALSFFEKGNKYPNDAAKCIFNLGAYAVESGNFAAALKHFERAIDLFKITQDVGMQMRTKGQIANAHHKLGNYDKALNLYENLLAEKEKVDNPRALCVIYNNISALYSELGNLALSLKYCLEVSALAERTNDLWMLADTYDNISVIYFDLNDKKQAQYYQRKALDIYRELNHKDGIAKEMVNIAISSYDDHTEAIAAFQEAVAYCKAVDNKVALARAHQNLSYHFLLQKDYRSSYWHAQQGLEIEKEINNINNSMLLNFSMADVLIYCDERDLISFGVEPDKRYEKAKEYVHTAMSLDNGLTPSFQMRAWLVLSATYEKEKDYIQAYDAYKKYMVLKDSTAGDDIRKQITRKQIQYEFDKKETELKYQQQLTADQLEKQRLLTVQQEQALALNRQTLALKEQALTLSNKEKDLAHLAYLKEQAEKQEKAQELSLSQEREKGKERDLSLKNLELSAQQKQNIYLIAFAALLLAGLSALLYFYNALKKQKNIIAQQNEINEHTIAILSHDIKAPLMGVKLLLKKLNKDDPFVAQASQSLEDQINSVNGILNNLLRMKKMALVQQNQKTSANVNDAVQNVLLELRTAIQAKGLSVQNDLKGDATLPIAPEKLQIIFHNLLSNAVKYSFPHQPIRIFHEGRGIAIQDFGVGLSPEQRSKLMREVTASQAGTQQERGNGLGLFLVGAMLQGEAIRIAFESPEVGGTIVKVL